jgi:hypothetical protein
MIRPDMAQLDIDHHKRVERDVHMLLGVFAVSIAFAVCLGIGLGYLIWGTA